MIQLQAQGYFTWAVLNEKDKIVRYAPTYSPNLILDQGLDGIAVRTWADSFVVCAVGTSPISPLKNQTGLQAESKRTATYLDLQSANKSSLLGNVLTLQRTFVFQKEGVDMIYKEAGFGYSLSGPNNLFSRVTLPNVLVSTGERIIIQYQLLIYIGTTKPKSFTNPIIDKKNASSGVLQYQRCGLMGINNAGISTIFDDSEASNEPSVASQGFLSINNSAPAAFGYVVNRAGTTFEKSLNLSNYVSGKFTRDKILSLGNKEAVRSWFSAGVGANSGNSFSKTGLVYVFNAAYPKAFGKLNLAFTYIWSRKILNAGDALYYWQDEDNMVLKRNTILNYYGLNDG